MLLAGDGGERRAEDAYSWAAVRGGGGIDEIRRDEVRARPFVVAVLALALAVPLAAAAALAAATALLVFLLLRLYLGAVHDSYMFVRGAKMQRRSRPTRKKGRRVSASVEKAAEMVKRSHMGGAAGGRGIAPAIVVAMVLGRWETKGGWGPRSVTKKEKIRLVCC